MLEPPPPAHRRADHIRNRAALLEAARDVFAGEGADAPVSEIARRAGIAKGTFFRHFPTKESLVQALLAERLVKLAEVADEINTTHPPAWSTLCLMLERFLDQISGDRSLGDFMERGVKVGDTPEIREARRRLGAEIERAVDAAQATGEVRPDIGGEDISLIVFMVTKMTARHRDAHPDLARRYLRLFLDGIRSGHVTDLGPPAPSRAELVAGDASGRC